MVVPAPSGLATLLGLGFSPPYADGPALRPALR